MISVIVPVYNVKKYLRVCVESIINQTYRDLEILLIDDGSTDGSGELCDKLAKCDERIRVIHKSNGGLSSARNKGIDLAKGEYLLFVDSDDYIHPKMVGHLYELADNGKYKITMCNVHKVNEKETKCINHRNLDESSEKLLSRNQVLKGICIDWRYVVTWNKLYNRTVFDNLSFKEDIVNEDFEIAVKLYDKVPQIMVTNAQLYYYRQRIDGIMSTRWYMNNISLFDTYRERINYFHNNKEYCLLRLNIIDLLARCYDGYNDSNRRIEHHILIRIRKDLMYYLNKYARILNRKTRLKMIAFILSPYVACNIKRIKEQLIYEK